MTGRIGSSIVKQDIYDLQRFPFFLFRQCPTFLMQPAAQPTTSTLQQDSGKPLSFFERIFQMILDFFARLFGR